ACSTKARMLLPRPEIRIATRFGSRIVGRGPVLARAPCSCRSVDGAAPLAFLDAADLERGLAGALERVVDLGRILRRDQDSHSDTAVEGPRHFFRSDPPARLQRCENGGQLPS